MYYIPEADDISETQQVKISKDHGGWGGVTMGVLTAKEKAIKAYGILGFGYSTVATDTIPAFDADK